MQDVAQKIALYHNLFLVCLILSIVCFIVAAILFFVLDIPNVWGYLTGRRAKKQIQQMEESSAASGRLMARRRSNMQNMAQGIQEDMGIRSTVTPGARKVEHMVESVPENAEQQTTGAEETALLKAQTQQAQETGKAAGSGAGSKEAAPAAVQETQAESPKVNDNGSTGVLDVTLNAIGTFAIEKEIILIHAEEVI